MNSTRILKLQALILPGLLWGGMVHARSFEDKEHHLGPTGLFGVTSPADIRITQVAEGSPAEGRIKEGDVIVAVGGVPFKDNTRMLLAAAIDEAETEQAKGILTLALNDGRKVDLKLKVLGTYSANAPYKCPKTEAIITQTAEAIARSKEFAVHGVPIDLLGLLATGDPKYVGVVKNVIHSALWASPDLELSLADSGIWRWGYTNLLLAEYYLLTKDEYVLPALKTHSVALAEGRDAAGLWGHRVANPETNSGQLHGRLPGYAVMNQSSLPCFISLMLADKCGIAVLASLGIKGGIEAAFATLDDPNGKAGFKIRLLMDVLPRYGANAKYMLPRIKGNEVGKFQKQWNKMVEDIENAPPPSREMLTMEEAKQYGLKKTN